jgi:hypothetical protein
MMSFSLFHIAASRYKITFSRHHTLTNCHFTKCYCIFPQDRKREREREKMQLCYYIEKRKRNSNNAQEMKGGGGWELYYFTFMGYKISSAYCVNVFHLERPWRWITIEAIKHRNAERYCLDYGNLGI